MRRAFAIVAVLTVTANAWSGPADSTMLRDSDDEVQITAPPGWTSSDPNAWARIRAINPHLTAGFLVLHKPKTKDDVVKDLKGFAEAGFRVDASRGEIRNSHLDGPKSLTLNGHPCLQYVQTCQLGKEKTETVVLRTYIELNHSWNGVVCWTTRENIEKCMPDFKRITESFGEVGAATTEPSPGRAGA